MRVERQELGQRLLLSAIEHVALKLGNSAIMSASRATSSRDAGCAPAIVVDGGMWYPTACSLDAPNNSGWR